MSHQPTIETHVPITTQLPTEGTDLAVGRPDIPPPSLWQQSVKVVHKLTGRSAVVARVDWSMNMFRAYYPDQGDLDPITKMPKGRFAERTEWEHCRDWDVAVTFSPKELERQAARQRLDEEISQLDATSMAAVMVLCDDPDPAKALGKLEALRRLGVVKASPEAAKTVMTEAKKGK